MRDTERRPAGVLGFFDNPEAILVATAKVKSANYRYFDVFSPYPIHGLDHAQGLKRSPIPYVTFIAGLTGFLLAFLFEYWTSAVDWPVNVGGKPYNSWPAFVPIMFELTVLFAGLSTVGAMFAFNGLPNLRRKAFDPSLTNNRFAIVIENPPEVGMDSHGAKKTSVTNTGGFKEFSESEASQFLKQLGATEVRIVYAEGWF
jgi:hypothetical protein